MRFLRGNTLLLSCLTLIFGGFLVREHLAHARDVAGPGPSLTIYNQRFGVVRQPISVNLKEGANHVDVNDITGHLEPDSVILRSLDGRQLKILEQNYRNDAITQQLLLSLYEGKTIDFVTPEKQMVKGKIIRSGFVPHSASAYSMYGQAYYQAQMAYTQAGSG